MVKVQTYTKSDVKKTILNLKPHDMYKDLALHSDSETLSVLSESLEVVSDMRSLAGHEVSKIEKAESRLHKLIKKILKNSRKVERILKKIGLDVIDRRLLGFLSLYHLALRLEKALDATKDFLASSDKKEKKDASNAFMAYMGQAKKLCKNRLDIIELAIPLLIEKSEETLAAWYLQNSGKNIVAKVDSYKLFLEGLLERLDSYVPLKTSVYDLEPFDYAGDMSEAHIGNIISLFPEHPAAQYIYEKSKDLADELFAYGRFTVYNCIVDSNECERLSKYIKLREDGDPENESDWIIDMNGMVKEQNKIIQEGKSLVGKMLSVVERAINQHMA